MISKFMIATFVAAALAGCASDDTRPTREDRLAQCEASCAAMDGTFESLDQQGCVCRKTETRAPASFDNRCTVSGCVGVCGAGLCVNASSNNSGGCNYYCLAPSVEPEPEPEPVEPQSSHQRFHESWDVSPASTAVRGMLSITWTAPAGRETHLSWNENALTSSRKADHLPSAGMNSGAPRPEALSRNRTFRSAVTRKWGSRRDLG